MYPQVRHGMGTQLGKYDMEGTVTLTLNGATLQETERCRDVIHKLFKAGVLNVKAGSATLHFDERGALRQVKIEHITFKV